MNTVVLLAGGMGSRMGQDIPKQFIHVNNIPIIVYTLMALEKHPEIDAVQAVCIEGWEKVLTGYVMVSYTKQASSGWSGELEELDTNKDYDGFNYYLEGNGKGKLTFRWNPTYVSINKDFLNNRNNKFYYKDNDNYVAYQAAPVEADLTPDGDGMVSLIIEVDSAEQNRYEVQFYKTDSKVNDYTYSVVKDDYLPDTVAGDWESDTSGE